MKLEDISRHAAQAQAIDTSGRRAVAELPTIADAVPGLERPFYRNGLKRLSDLTITVLAVPLLVPVVLLLALLVMRDGHNPFYSQKRLGRGGRVYRMWKLRSMVPHADAKLEEILATDHEARAEWDAHQKLKSDPRVTRVGHILRRFSLDELPQFFNVITGDMSLVGPRPMMPEQASLYPGLAYYSLRPGLTGPWQVSERNESSFAERAGYDDAYVRVMSFGTDLRLIFRTVGVMLRGTGC